MGNLLGDGFDDFVRKQIDIRQKSLGKYTNISAKDLLYYQNKTPFLKLASSVNFEPGEKDNNTTSLANLLKISEDEIKDSNLARKCILHGGVVDKETPTPQSGLRFKNDNIFSGAYGWGGGERGFVPQPGITGADVTYYNDGALSSTTVSIKCFSREQFAIIDALYMRPGFSVLLEFGWSLYLDENNNLTSMDSFDSPALDRFFGDKSDDNFAIYKKIKEGREKYKGNYDGIYGKISKFDWKFNNDGSYDITIQITGYGDMIESLKASIFTPSLTVEPQNYKTDFINQQAESFSTRTEEFTQLQIQEEQNQVLIPDFKTTIHKLLYEVKNQSWGIDKNKSIYFSELNDLRIEWESKSSNLNSIVIEKTDYYITLYKFFKMVEDYLLPQSNGVPIFRFDIIDLKTNPSKSLQDDENYFLSPPGQFSSNPDICLIPSNLEINKDHTILPNSFNKILFNQLNDNNQNFREGNLGKLMSIYVNTGFIKSTLDGLMAESQFNDNPPNVFDFLNIIIKGIKSSLGGINNFHLKVDNDEAKIRIMDMSPEIMDLTESSEFSKFNLFGVSPNEGSFIRNIDLSSQISNEFSSLISIAAQANSTQPGTLSYSFESYNRGLVDRIYPSKIIPFDNLEQQENLKEEKKKIEIEKAKMYEFLKDGSKFNRYIEQVYGDRKLADVDSLNSMNSEFQKLILTNSIRNKTAKAPFFLPFNLKLTMDGLGGMKLYQRFEMDGKVLPPSYDPTLKTGLDLIINGINHSISPTGWTTTLDSLSVPKTPDKSPTDN